MFAMFNSPVIFSTAVKITKIVSGGQTGADRAALDFGLENGIEIGGYVPRGRLAEDGRIPDRYPNLIETETPEPAVRTELNVLHSDGTLIVTQGKRSGGSELTRHFADLHSKPNLHVDLSIMSEKKAAELVRQWLGATGVKVLNVAGPRASEDSGIYDSVKGLLQKLHE